MTNLCRLRASATLALSLIAVAADAGGAVAVEGIDRARMLAPAGAQIEDYENAGYRLRHQGGEILIDVETSALESTSAFDPPSWTADHDPVTRLARGLTAGATTQYEAISRILSWVSKSISYKLDRSLSQAADRVLARRSGYCTGIARLTVALLQSAGLQAREVAGYVVDSGNGGPAGFHRWVEVHLADRGWIFSDPLRSHHYVPATYLRLAGEALQTEAGLEGLLIERRNTSTEIDLFPYGPSGITARRNSARRVAAALQVDLESRSDGLAVLTGNSQRRSRRLIDGATTFLGLEPGRYVLRLELPGTTVERPVDLPDRIRRSIFLPSLHILDGAETTAH